MSQRARLKLSVLHLARFTLEAKTPLSIGTGGSDGVYDHPVVRDANGLPMIPGTSLAGVLRHLWIDLQGEDSAGELFGYQEGSRGRPSRLEVAHCAIQDSQGRPVEGLLLGQERKRLETDPLLRAAWESRADPIFRDRVRLTHRGVAKQTGKFDRGIVLAGTRFSGELRLWSDRKDDPDWSALLSLFADPRLRLGGATRAGLGALRLVDGGLYTASFELNANPEDIARFRALSPRLGDLGGLQPTKPPAPPNHAPVQRLHLRLAAQDFWRIGQGSQSLRKGTGDDKTPDLLPKTEPVVRWLAGKGSIQPRLVLIPASSLKGALAHRTAFHWHLLTGQFVDQMDLQAIQDWEASEHCEAVRALFGYAKDREDAAGRSRAHTGQVGQVLFDDLYLTPPDPEEVGWMMHNSIDRFTGGVRNRMLFCEELLYKQSFDLEISLLPRALSADPLVRRAFARALDDLCQGRLALGGGTTKGHGCFRGEPLDEDTRNWLQTQLEETA